MTDHHASLVPKTWTDPNPLETRGLWEVRFHGRGGQGTVVASILLAQAAFFDGRGVQAFPFFGVERRGAPVVAHARIGKEAVRIACSVASPDAVVVMDPSLVVGLGPALVGGLGEDGLLLVNSPLPPEDLPLDKDGLRVATVDATGIARRHGLGSASNPIVNTAVLGALVRVTDIVDARCLEDAIVEKVPAHKEENLAAARDAYLEVRT